MTERDIFFPCSNTLGLRLKIFRLCDQLLIHCCYTKNNETTVADIFALETIKWYNDQYLNENGSFE